MFEWVASIGVASVSVMTSSATHACRTGKVHYNKRIESGTWTPELELAHCSKSTRTYRDRNEGHLKLKGTVPDKGFSRRDSRIIVLRYISMWIKFEV